MATMDPTYFNSPLRSRDSTSAPPPKKRRQTPRWLVETYGFNGFYWRLGAVRYRSGMSRDLAVNAVKEVALSEGDIPFEAIEWFYRGWIYSEQADQAKQQGKS